MAIAFTCGNLIPVAEVLRAKYPALDIVICADDDSGTDGNPGLTKAAESAKAVNGFLATPVFPESRGAKDTDFNDLARLAGSGEVIDCIENASLASSSSSLEGSKNTQQEKIENTSDALIRKFAALSPLEYDQVRKMEAKVLGIRTGTLDNVVKAARNKNNNDLPFAEVDPWPEPINPSVLLTDIATTIRRFIVCDEASSNAAALTTGSAVRVHAGEPANTRV